MVALDTHGVTSCVSLSGEGECIKAACQGWLALLSVSASTSSGRCCFLPGPSLTQAARVLREEAEV